MVRTFQIKLEQLPVQFSEATIQQYIQNAAQGVVRDGYAILPTINQLIATDNIEMNQLIQFSYMANEHQYHYLMLIF